MKTAELTGAALDWAVAKCGFVQGTARSLIASEKRYSTDWEQAGPIIEREDIAVWPDAEEGGWFASSGGGRGTDYKGTTPLIAAMRCYVTSKLGDEVELPEELIPRD